MGWQRVQEMVESTPLQSVVLDNNGGVMETHVTVQIPQALYRRAQRLAQNRHQALADVLADALRLSEAALAGATPEEIAMEREEAAYQAMHADLLAHHAGQYVAIHEGKLIDHDRSELALLQRLNAHHPNAVVLLRQVRPLPEPDLYVRSPRFVGDNGWQ